MKIKYVFIICAVLFKLVKTESECSVHLKCFSEFIRNFVKSGQKYAVIFKETKNDGDDSDTSLLTVEIPSKKLINSIKQLIDLFELYIDSVSEVDNQSESTESIEDLIHNVENDLSEKQIVSVVNQKDFKSKSESDLTDILMVKDKDAVSSEPKIDEFDYYYDIEHDNATDYPFIDYIELYKDTTNEPVDVPVTVTSTTEQELHTKVYERNSLIENKTINILHTDYGVQKQCSFNGTSNNITRSVFPWIAAIFVKNDSSGRFDYYCDGVLLSDRSILTAAQCVSRNASTIAPEDFIAILGKRSFSVMKDEEKTVKINQIRVHENFTHGHYDDYDLAVLQTDDVIPFKDDIQPACLSTGNDTDALIHNSAELATTGWAMTGELTSITLDKEKSKLCQKYFGSDDIFCANYENDVTTCPSYGGVFVIKSADGVWRIRGLRTGEPSQIGFCINTGVFYTDLLRHWNWIHSNI